MTNVHSNLPPTLPPGLLLAIGIAFELAEAAPAEAEQYEIYRGQDEIGRTFTKVGYGRTGIGTEGAVKGSNPYILAYFGQNRFDALGEDFYGNLVVPDSQLLYDFDNGMSERNVFLSSNGLSDLGLGNKEVNIAPGDSGSPAFIGNLVGGISSYNASDFDIDIDSVRNSSLGEIAGDVRVSSYASFIDAAVAGEVPSTTSVPEPSLTLGTFAFGAWGASNLLRRSKKRKSA